MSLAGRRQHRVHSDGRPGQAVPNSEITFLSQHDERANEQSANSIAAHLITPLSRQRSDHYLHRRQEHWRPHPMANCNSLHNSGASVSNNGTFSPSAAFTLAFSGTHLPAMGRAEGCYDSGRSGKTSRMEAARWTFRTPSSAKRNSLHQRK